MASLKEQLQEVIASLRNDCTMEGFRFRLYVRQRIHDGVQAIDEGRVHSIEEAWEVVKSWRKSGVA